jgi:hypothetical protein
MTLPRIETTAYTRTSPKRIWRTDKKDLARQHAEETLAILDSHTVPASSWTDTDQYRGEIRCQQGAGI